MSFARFAYPYPNLVLLVLQVWHNTRGTVITFAIIPGVSVPIRALPQECRVIMHSDLMSPVTPNTKIKINIFMFASFLSEIAVVLAAAVLQVSVRLFSFSSLGGLQYMTYVTCLCVLCMNTYFLVRCLKYRSHYLFMTFGGLSCIHETAKLSVTPCPMCLFVL